VVELQRRLSGVELPLRVTNVHSRALRIGSAICWKPNLQGRRSAIRWFACLRTPRIERVLCAADSTDRRNTLCELLRWRLILQGLARPLLEIIYAIGLATDGTEQSRLWQEFSSHEPSHKTERDDLLQLAEAEDPFALVRRDRTLSLLLRNSVGLHRAGGRWRKAGYSLSSLRKTDWNSLSTAEQTEFRKMLDDAAGYQARLVRRGPVQKTRLDTALLDLADLYLSWTGQTVARHHVPYAAESRFIQFAVAALEPVGQYFEVSRSALSGRWERIVLDARKEERELGAALPAQDPEQNL